MGGAGEENIRAGGMGWMCPDIQHPGITGCPVPELKKHVAAIDASLNSTDENNPGLAYRFGLFVMQWKESEKERNIQTRRFRFWVMAGIGLLAALATIYDGLKANEQIQHHQLQWPKFGTSTAPALAGNNQPPSAAYEVIHDNPW